MNEKLSLKEFFNKEYSRIEIPKIQRDYAQGRENESEVADRFLDKIFECLKDGTNLELDFIYGSVNNKIVYLLDGQQRVTTLFLLYWYMALREDIFNEEIKEYLKKFTYSTRVSSREFCQNIIDNIEKIKKYYDDEVGEKKYEVKLSNIIKNFYWFTNENDPTIKAMINMIDKIDDKYNEISKNDSSIKLFNNLEKIKFYFLPLENFNLTDEIYLKMNARGKSLTSFENFKADFTDYILKINGNKIDSSIQLQLSDLDNKYTNLFWTLSKEYNNIQNKSNNIILDDLYMKFFYRITLIYFIISYKGSNEKLIKEKYYTEYLNENNKYSSFNAFEKTYNNNKDIINTIFRVLDILESKYSHILNIIKPIWDSTNYNILSKIVYEYKDIIIFAALVFYIDKNNIDKNNYNKNETSFKQWMRIVWNITENSYIDESSSISLIKLFYELSEHSSNIYDFLANEEKIIHTNISKEAVQYERRKCKFIIKDNNWETYFIEAEKHQFFRGYIDFLIDDNMDIDKFNHRKEMMNEVFDSNGTKGEFLKNHLFLRALISKINYIDYLRIAVTDVREIFRNIIKSNPCYIYNKEDETYLYMHDIIKQWFDISEDKEKLLQLLENEISSNKSDIYFWGKEEKSDFTIAKAERIKLAHEALYKNNDLHNWIYEVNENNKYKNTMMKVDWRYDNLYLLFPNTKIDKVLIASYRNKLIKYLIKEYGLIDENGFEITDANGKGIGYYKKWATHYDIVLVLNHKKTRYLFTFDNWNNLYIKNETSDNSILEYSLNNYTFNEYKGIIKSEFFDKYIK